MNPEGESQYRDCVFIQLKGIQKKEGKEIELVGEEYK